MRQAVAILLLFLTIPIFAQYDKKPRVTSRSQKVFDNTNCTTTNTCDLKQVRFRAEDYEIWVGDRMSYGTRFFAHYTTDTVEDLENYAFVQFIKGCQYSSHDNGDVFLSVSTEHFSEWIDFNHQDWVIDSGDTDPVYFSTPDLRHFSYKWNAVQNSTDRDTERRFALEKPSYPELYITDIPHTAFYNNSGAQNISLAFKTCLYRTSDVPIETTPDNIDFAEPVTCFHWYSSWVYDHEQEKFTHPYYIAPACDN